MKPTVFIHTNDKQLLGAKVSAYSLRRASATPEAFDVRLIRLEEQPALYSRQGQRYKRKGASLIWDNEDLQSFTPTRFLAPQLMGYQGRAVVIDPDVFAVGDICELLQRDMQGKSIVCRKVFPADGRKPYFASSVMLLDCGKLSHWRWEEQVERLFTEQLDYHDWMNLYVEPEETIGPLEEEWNSFDKLTPTTRLLHNTNRLTQPWKSGLPIDFVKHEPPRPGGKLFGVIPVRFLPRALQPRPYRPNGVYQPHPDPRQEELFFGLARECLENGEITEEMVRASMACGGVRADFLQRVSRALVPQLS